MASLQQVTSENVEGLFDFHVQQLKGIIPQDHRIFCDDEKGLQLCSTVNMSAQVARKKWRL
jgi:hypothetical protein